MTGQSFSLAQNVASVSACSQREEYGIRNRIKRACPAGARNGVGYQIDKGKHGRHGITIQWVGGLQDFINAEICIVRIKTSATGCLFESLILYNDRTCSPNFAEVSNPAGLALCLPRCNVHGVKSSVNCLLVWIDKWHPRGPREMQRMQPQFFISGSNTISTRWTMLLA